MFTLLGKVLSYVVGTTTEVVKEPRQHVQDSTDSSDEEEEEEEKDFHGQVLSVNEAEGYGSVTGDIYFDFGVVVGDVIPKVGDATSGRASRRNKTDNWRAKRILAVGEFWEEDLTRRRDEATAVPDDLTIGSVTFCKEGRISVNDDLHFQLRDLSTSFQPEVGDVVTLSRIEENGVVRTELKPLMERKIDAEVTFTKDNWGVIHDEIWFSFNVCRSGYKPWRGDAVAVTAVESQQGKNRWRATLVTPRNPSTSGTPPFLKSPTQNHFLKELCANKGGIEVTSPFDFGPINKNEKKYLTAWIKNTSDGDRFLLAVKFQTSDKCPFALGDAKISGISPSPIFDPEEGLTIPPGVSAYVNIVCEAEEAGKHQNLLIFTFRGFVIGRHVSVDVFHGSIQQSLLPSAPYLRKGTVQAQYSFGRNGVVVPGERPVRSVRNIPTHLPQYPVPERLWHCVTEGMDILDIAPALKEYLNRNNYSEHFSALLHLEEIQMTLDMREFDMKEECLSPRGEYLCLVVPGLAEGRPSLLIGDKIYLSVPDCQEENSPIFEGFIHEVFQDAILLKFNSSFHGSYSGESFDVTFAFNRTPLRRCHLAVRQVDKIDAEVLFPSRLQAKQPQVHIQNVEKPPTGQDHLVASDNGRNIHWFNDRLNERQKAAIKNILCGYCRPLPYVIFGPPGTGKTVTVVETILQVFSRLPCSRILVCTPSNSAADLIVERLDESGILNSAHLVRLNAFQRREDLISDRVKGYCLNDVELQQVVYRRIVVTTCTTAGTLYSLGLQTKHFTHLFVDEAGQATEPECMVALNLVSLGQGQVVLAGDPRQLGPVLRSKLSKFYGLQDSLLERLMQRPLYTRDEKLFSDHGNYDPFLVTKLVKNYRSHSAVLKVPSELFYHDELISCAPDTLIRRFCESELLPKSGFPLILHAVESEDYREANSPSWFNPAEAYYAAKYLQDLYKIGVGPDDVGIITPYRKQVEKIRLLLSSLDLVPCKVGSVEEFQGQERLVIILSTVRSCEQMVEFDVKHNLGFLSNPKRFNVAITRAQALLIVIGNPNLLSKDSNWNALLKYCCDNGAYVTTT